MNKAIKTILVISVTVFSFGVLFVSPAQAQPPNLEVEFEYDPLFYEANFFPGDTVSRWVKVTNNTTEVQPIATQAVNVSDPDGLSEMFHLQIKEAGQIRYSDTLANFFSAGEVFLSNLAGNGTQTQYDYKATFYPATGNPYQGKYLAFDIIVGFQGEQECVAEICDNGLDDDCDGDVDCDDEDCANDPNCQEPGPLPECEPGATQSCSTGLLGICASGTQTCSAQGYWGDCLQNNEPTTEDCSNGLDDDCDGYTDGDDNDCILVGPLFVMGTGGPGSGGGEPVALMIYGEQNVNVQDYSIIVSWVTTKLSTSRVVYDTISHPTIDLSDINYGYAFSTVEDGTKVQSHIVTITGLMPGTIYYWRAISHTSPEEALGDEIVFQTTGEALPAEQVGGEEEDGEETGGETGAGPTGPAVQPVCGDGNLDPGEECDDGNTENGDGCSALCVIEISEEPEITEEDQEMFLAATGNLFDLDNLWLILILLLIILFILFILFKKRKKKKEETK